MVLSEQIKSMWLIILKTIAQSLAIAYKSLISIIKGLKTNETEPENRCQQKCVTDHFQGNPHHRNMKSWKTSILFFNALK